MVTKAFFVRYFSICGLHQNLRICGDLINAKKIIAWTVFPKIVSHLKRSILLSWVGLLF